MGNNDNNSTPKTTDEWIRALAEHVSQEARLIQMKDGRFSENDVSETIDEYESVIRDYLKRSGIYPNNRRAAGGWRTMDSAPLNGKHCILSVPEADGFIYSVQGAYQDGQWNAVHRDNVKPLYWMPNALHPSPDTGNDEMKNENR